MKDYLTNNYGWGGLLSVQLNRKIGNISNEDAHSQYNSLDHLQKTARRIEFLKDLLKNDMFEFSIYASM